MAFGLYRLVLRYVGVDTLLRLLAAVSICFAALLAAAEMNQERH
jgi:FlaA1/EpsC-like NDP-sugar epimerase